MGRNSIETATAFRAVALALVLSGLFVCGPVAASGVSGVLTDAGTADADGDSTEALDNPRIAYADGHVWLGAGVRVPLQSATVAADGALLVLGVDDAVYRRGSDGVWMEILPPSRSALDGPEELDEEDILMDAEGFLDELVDLTADSEPLSDEESSSDDPDEDMEEEPERVIEPDAAGITDMADLWTGDERGDGSDLGPRPDGIIWASTRTAGLVLLSRPDGVWRSNDHGLSWAPSEGIESVHSFEDGHAGHVLAGTAYGLRVSVTSGNDWDKINDPIVGVEVFSFARDGDRIFAGTKEGLFRSDDGLHWAKLLSRHDSDVPVWSIAVDPFWEAGLWVTGPVGVLRSDDGGEQLRSASRNSLPGTVSLLALEAPGHLLAAGLDGVWESSDGGMRWRPLANGLPSPSNHLLLPGPFVAGADGLFRLEAAEYAADAPIELVSDTVEGTDVGTLVATALNRPGMDLDNVLTHGSIARSYLFPTLQITGKATRNRYLSADYDARSNKGSSQRSWSMAVTACFGACYSASGQTSSSIESVVDGSVSYDSVAVVGDEVYGANESGSLAPMAANVSERLTRYRTNVSSVVGELAQVRHRLVEASSTVRTLSLLQQVNHELDVLESTARIDVYTNGYFSRVLEGS